MKPDANIIFANFFKKQEKAKFEDIIQNCGLVIIFIFIIYFIVN